MLCSVCGVEIPQERLEVLPHTTTCVRCSTEKKNLAVPVFDHKTGGQCVIVDAKSSENVRIAKRYIKRAR